MSEPIINELAKPGRRETPAVRSFELAVPEEFNFQRTVLSHGWFDLPPFQWDAGSRSLLRTLSLPEAGPVTVRIRQGKRGEARTIVSRIAAARRPTPADLRSARRDVAHMFRLDEDLASFYRRAGELETPDLGWTASAGAGRLLRSPDVFEDLSR